MGLTFRPPVEKEKLRVLESGWQYTIQELAGQIYADFEQDDLPRAREHAKMMRKVLQALIEEIDAEIGPLKFIRPEGAQG
jgi:hypothetical protein